jgi:hypothetical protein
MSRPLHLVLVGALVAAGTAHGLRAQAVSAKQWQEDLAYVSSAIRTRHPSPFREVSAEFFQAGVERLNGRIPELDDHEIVVEMSALVAALRDGHTAIRGGFQFLSGQYPLRLIVLDDGIFVQSAPDALKGAVGTRLVRLGDVSGEEAFQRVASITSHDNEMTLRSRVPGSMTIPEILHALKITRERDRARFVLGDRQGREFVLDLTPLPFDERLNWVEFPGVDTRPLYLRDSLTDYWHEYLENSATLYVQYNRVRDRDDESIAEYFTRISEFTEQTPLDRVVLDVRFNGGGNDYLNAPVVDWVKSALSLVNGHVYVIVGRGTYSAAQKLVTRLEATTEVILVGEPTGGSPNHFGDAVTLQFRYSDLTLSVSSQYHNDAPDDARWAIEPDLSTPLDSEAYFSGRDPAMDTILSTSTASSPTRQ